MGEAEVKGGEVVHLQQSGLGGVQLGVAIDLMVQTKRVLSMGSVE